MAEVASTNAPIIRVDSSVEGVPLSRVRLRVISMECWRSFVEPVAIAN